MNPTIRRFSVLAPMLAVLALLSLLAMPTTSNAQQNSPFTPGWTLDAEASELRLLSIKKGNVAESSNFATFSGAIASDGNVEIAVMLDSIDTRIDLRNVRMRFLFFETFKFPEATIKARLTPAMIADLRMVRRKTLDLSYTLDLHGVVANRTDRVLVTLLDDDRVAISTTNPIILPVSDFSLGDGLEKLQEAANVDIVPIGTISFDFVFARDGGGESVPPTPEEQAPATAALEPTGDLDTSACAGRFEILSRTGNIFFGSGSANLDPASGPLLTSIADIVNRCPGMRVEIVGHTDSDGETTSNQRLSEARAGAVLAYLTSRGIAPSRLIAMGRGESEPAFPNTSARNKSRNRRIEFSALTR